MKIYLFLNNSIKVFMIPEIVSGSYNFDEDENAEDKLINIDSRDNKWVLYSTEDSSIIGNNQIIREVQLEPHRFYSLQKNKTRYLIYTEKFVENDFKSYVFNNSLNLIVGSTQECNAIFKSPFEDGVLFKVGYVESDLVLEKQSKYKVYVNNVAVNEKCTLKSGDTINYYGLKIIIIKDRLLISSQNKPIDINTTAAGLTMASLKSTAELKSIEVKDKDLYSKENYFSKSPRLRREIETKKIELTTPPEASKEKPTSLLLTIAPMLIMALTSLITFGNIGQSLSSGESTIKKAWPQLATASVMIVSALVWPMISRKLEKLQKERERQQLIDKYNAYLKEKIKELELEKISQKEIIKENLIDLNECLRIIESKTMQLWDKRLDQSDLLEIRAGIGSAKFDVDIEFPEEGFVIDENELKDNLDKIKNLYKYIDDVPVGYSLAESRITAVMGNMEKAYYFVYNILVQLLTFYSYEDLKIVIITNEQNEKKWDFMKYCLHTFTNDKSIRFFSSSIDSLPVLMDYLNQNLSARLENKTDTPTPHYLIITDDYARIKSQKFINELAEVKEDANAGMSFLILEKKMNNLPSKCSHFILIGDKTSGILKNSYEKQEQITFVDEINYSIDMMEVVRRLSNIPIEFAKGGQSLPESLTFLEMEKVGKVEQLNVLSRWNSNSPTETLKAELGVGENGELMYLDLHEKAHGPHGLIAGMTGSGKSEFIITYILAMAVNYSPDDVAFILIDYKGGGLAYAFENKTTNTILPHLAGTITNLDKAEMDRTLVSIDSESKRRQRMFNEARDKNGESTIDIYKYQRFYREGKVSEPIPHLFIVCDEFAELKSQQPDFMENLISIARIGRSLGIHLILATQKPSGVVNEQIWSNSKFHICLKVQDAGDSQEMLKKPDAANLKQAGRFYMQVGYDEYFALGQSAWCGAKYFPSEKVIKEVDKSVNLIADNGMIIQKIQDTAHNKKGTAQGEQLSAIMQEIINTAQKVNKRAKRLWLENIPEVILIEDIKKKYGFEYNVKNKDLIIGEYDAPEEQKQGIVTYNFLDDGNTLIYSSESAENEFFLKSMVYQILKNYSSSEVNIYVIDYGAQTLRVFERAPHFGGYVLQGEDEKYHNLIKLLRNELEERKKILSDYSGDYKLYLEKGNKDLPLDVVIINNYDSLKDSDLEPFEELPDLLRDSERYGIVYFMTASAVNSVQAKVSMNFPNAYAYKFKDEFDYQSALGAKTKNVPRQIFARGMFKDGEAIHEFQTAYIASQDTDLNEFIRKEMEVIAANNPQKAKRIPELPSQVTLDYVESSIKKFRNVPIGIRKADVEIAKYDFTNMLGTIITGTRLVNTRSFVKSLITVFNKIEGTKVIVMDATGDLEEHCKDNKNYHKDNLVSLLPGMANYFKDQFTENVVIFLYGFGKMRDLFQDSSVFDTLVKNLNMQRTNVSLIIVEGINRFKDFTFENWYRIGFGEKDGIYVGTGAGDQNTIKINNFSRELSDEYPNNMGVMVTEGIAKIIKLIEFEKEKEEEDE